MEWIHQLPSRLLSHFGPFSLHQRRKRKMTSSGLSFFLSLPPLAGCAPLRRPPFLPTLLLMNVCRFNDLVSHIQLVEGGYTLFGTCVCKTKPGVIHLNRFRVSSCFLPPSLRLEH